MKKVLSQKTLILVIGVAGSGKTTIAKEVLQHIAAAYIDKDVLTDPFTPISRDSSEYLKIRPKIYQQMNNLAESNLQVGNTVVLDAPHVKEMQSKTWRTAIQKLVQRTDAKLIVVRCQCDEGVLRSRLQERGEERDKWKLENWSDFLRQEPIDLKISVPHIDIDTTDFKRVDIPDLIQRILDE